MLAFLFGLAGCASKPVYSRELCTAPVDLPVIDTIRDGREFLDLTVLIYQSAAFLARAHEPANR